MSTIKERATKYATEISHTRNGGVAELNPFTYKAYKRGAEDQHKIDIENACKWLKRELISFGYNEDETLIKELCKAMKQQF